MSDEVRENGSSERVLLVAVTDFYVRNYAGMLLQRFGYHVFAVDSMKDAADFLSRAVPRLVLADEGLARARGRDLLGGMKNDPRTAGVPVILLTSADEKKAGRLFSGAGYDAVLSMPLEPEPLYRAVQRAIEAHPRAFIRIGASIDARLGGESADYVPSSVVLSENGMFLRTTVTKPAGTRVAVSFVVMGRTITTEAAVLYSHGFDDYPQKELGMGLRFETISEEDKAVIRQYIHREIELGLVKR